MLLREVPPPQTLTWPNTDSLATATWMGTIGTNLTVPFTCLSHSPREAWERRTRWLPWDLMPVGLCQFSSLILLPSPPNSCVLRCLWLVIRKPLYILSPFSDHSSHSLSYSALTVPRYPFSPYKWGLLSLSLSPFSVALMGRIIALFKSTVCPPHTRTGRCCWLKEKPKTRPTGLPCD